MLITAAVRSHVHSGKAAIRGDLAHRPAAHTNAAFSNPLMSALMGNRIEPI